jgi:hypothetical protein
MKNPLLLLALAAVASGGCQSASNNAPQFEAGMSRLNFAIGFESMDHEGSAYTSAAGGVPTLADNGLDSSFNTAETTSVTLSGSYGLFLAPQIEVGTRIGLGFGSTDHYTSYTTDFDGDGFDDRAASTGNGSEDQTYLTLGGYSRYYLCDCWSIRPWVQADFGYALADFSGMYIGGSIGGTMFLDESSAIEARIYGETVSDDDDISGVGLEIGYSIF